MTSPKLRFKEFDGDWQNTTLEQLADVERGKFSVRPRNDPQYFGGTMPFVQTGDVTGSDVYLKGFSQTLNDEGIKVSKVFPKNTILITIAANIGDTTITQYPVACPDSVVAIQSKVALADTIFLKNLIDLQKENLDSQATQNAQKNINLQVLKPLELIVPNLKEQTKIASFLSKVDEKIRQLNQKYELLNQYKQGMMQKLFSQQIRFKADDGSEFGEWESSYIGDVCKITTGNKDTQNKIDHGEYPFFVRSQTIERINSYSMNCEAILTSGDGVGVGKNYHYINGRFDFHQRVYCLYDFSENILGKYLYIYFSSYFNDRVKRLSAKNSVDSVRMDMISKMEIQLPCLEEQTKIANFLSAIDQKIEVVTQQIEQAKTWKKGLLQQMFV